MDQKLVCMFLLMVGISHGLQCNVTTFLVTRTRTTFPRKNNVMAGFWSMMSASNLCKTSPKMHILLNYHLLKIHNFDCSNSDASNSFGNCDSLQFYMENFEPTPELGSCTYTKLAGSDTWIPGYLCLCNEDFCNNAQLKPTSAKASKALERGAFASILKFMFKNIFNLYGK